MDRRQGESLPSLRQRDNAGTIRRSTGRPYKMYSKKRASIFAVLILAGVIAAGIAFFLPAPVQRQAPDVRFDLLDGRRLALADLRGSPVLVTFWATTCAPCVEELPDLIALYKEFNPRGFELVAVAMPYDPPLQVERFVRQYQIPYPIALDVGGDVTQAFGGVDFIPLAYLIDPAGNIVHHRTGKLNIGRIRRMVNKLLNTAGARE